MATLTDFFEVDGAEVFIVSAGGCYYVSMEREDMPILEQVLAELNRW